MCFAPQRRELFRHLNFQKWSEHGVFSTFWFRSVLRAKTACTFFDISLPKVVRAWCVLCILTLKCASRRNGVHFFDIATSKNATKLRCLVHFDLKCASRHNGVQFSLSLIWPAGSAPAALASLLFDPPEPQISGQTTVFRDFPGLFAHLDLLSLNFSLSWSSFFFSSLLSLTLPISAFHLSILSESLTSNFLRLHCIDFQISPEWRLEILKGSICLHNPQCLHCCKKRAVFTPPRSGQICQRSCHLAWIWSCNKLHRICKHPCS